MNALGLILFQICNYTTATTKKLKSTITSKQNVTHAEKKEKKKDYKVIQFHGLNKHFQTNSQRLQHHTCEVGVAMVR